MGERPQQPQPGPQGIRGAAWNRLHCDRQGYYRMLQRRHVRPGNDNGADGFKNGGGLQDMVNHCPPADRVQDLWQGGLHPGSLAGSQNNGRKRRPGGCGHGR